MADKPVLYGFSGSTYVRTVRIVMAEKGLEYDQVPVNVLTGETRQPEHLKRHPFGKVPVLDIDGMRLRETEAICRYIDETRPGTAVVPADAKERAHMTEVVNLVNSYGYGPMIQSALHHLAPDFIGGADAAAQLGRMEEAVKLLTLVMEIRGDRPWIAGGSPSLADYFLGPILWYVSLTPEMARASEVPGVADWWARMSAHPSFEATEPQMG
jgi:glutathione S-transferase